MDTRLSPLIKWPDRKDLWHTMPQCFQFSFRKKTTVIIEFLVSKENVVLRRWERSKQKFGFIKRVDKG